MQSQECKCNPTRFLDTPATNRAVIWGGAKHMRGKRTRKRALPINFGPLQKSFRSALSWIFVQEKQRLTHEGGGKRTVRGGGPKPLFGRGVIREVFLPPLSPPPPVASSELILTKSFTLGQLVPKFLYTQQLIPK